MAMIRELPQKLGLREPRAGADRVWPGLPPKLQNPAAWLDIEPAREALFLLAAGAVQKRWRGSRADVSFFVSSVSPEQLREMVLLRVMRTCSAPPSAYQKGRDDLGDWSFTLGGEDNLFFTRGNLGGGVFCNGDGRTALEIARRVEAAILEVKPVEKDQLAKLLPRLAEPTMSRTQLRVGETVRLELPPEAMSQRGTSPFFEKDANHFETKFLDGPVIEVRAVKAGKAKVVACLVDNATLLCSSWPVEIGIHPAG